MSKWYETKEQLGEERDELQSANYELNRKIEQLNSKLNQLPDLESQINILVEKKAKMENEVFGWDKLLTTKDGEIQRLMTVINSLTSKH